MLRTLGILALLLAVHAPAARAIQVEDLDPARDWRLGALHIRGNHALGGRVLRDTMTTKPRPWFAVWRPRPPFEPLAFETDLERLAQLYRIHGYYEAHIGRDVTVPPEGDVVTVTIEIEEGPPVRVEQVDVTLGGADLPAADHAALLESLPLGVGETFTQEDYDGALARLRAYYREHGYARVRLAKRAEVDLEHHVARVAYEVESGPLCVFGKVRLEGLETVEPAVVRRELPFARGDAFRQSLLDRARQNLTGLGIFATVRIEEDDSREPRVDLRIQLVEAPPREIRLGAGYDTEEQVRGLASWHHYNFLGGARQLGFVGEISTIRRSLTAEFMQPHFPGSRNRTRLLVQQEQELEDTYKLDRTRGSPRVELTLTDHLTGYAFHRLEYDSLGDVTETVRRALPGGAPHNSVLSGFGFGTDWNMTDDLLDPTRGWNVITSIEPVGGALGGDISFVRAVGDLRLYRPLVGRFRGAARLRVGAAEPFGDSPEIPLFERFYAGGLKSVRGYGRRRIGPLVDDEPIGGRTLVETSVELRHPLTESLVGAIFLDGGQVALDSWDFAFDDLRYGSGFGVRYHSPIGPLALDIGFPVQPPPGDQRWQIHVSFGSVF